ncbi:MAG: sulfur carrier protein ThiS [Eggerthella lenta]
MAQVNGRARPEADGSTLAQLLERDGFDAARVAVRAERAIVPRDAYAATVLGRRRAGSGPLRGRRLMDALSSRIGEERARGWRRRAWAWRGWAAWGRTSP